MDGILIKPMVCPHFKMIIKMR